MSRNEPEPAGGGWVAYNLVDSTTAQRDALGLLLRGREIPHEWSRDHVVVPATCAADVDDMVHGLDLDPPRSGSGLDPPSGETATGTAQRIEHVIAGPARRMIGAALDVVVWTVVSFGLSYIGPFGEDAEIAHVLTMIGAIAAYQVVSVAQWGRTLGKLVAGTQVVAVVSGAAPGWSRAVLRWAVPSIVDLGFLLQGDGLVAGLASRASAVVTFVVYFGVLRQPLRQGLHDKAAGTVVVLTPRADDGTDDRFARAAPSGRHRPGRS